MRNGGHPHIDSDVDMAVTGLPAMGFMRTLLDVEGILGAEVPLVRLEETSASLRREIELAGELPHDPS